MKTHKNANPAFLQGQLQVSGRLKIFPKKFFQKKSKGISYFTQKQYIRKVGAS
jgi:hypothetical protein